MKECVGGWGDVLITEFLISERSTAALEPSLSHTHFLTFLSLSSLSSLSPSFSLSLSLVEMK
jgi:hypothetical protein